MAKIKGLKEIALTGALALGINGCSNSEYTYHGKIGNETVHFQESPYLSNINTLTIKREDGTIIKYVDEESYNQSFGKLDYIEITKDKKTVRYDWDKIGIEVLDEGQRQYTAYLKKIIEVKRQEGLKILKGN